MVWRYGARWVDWDRTDYCAFFAAHKGWLPTDTMRQPVGVLDRIVDSWQQAETERKSKSPKANADGFPRG